MIVALHDMKVSPLLLATTFTTLVQPIAAALCPLTTEGLSGLDTEYAFTDLNKLNVLDFSATVTYTTLPAGTEHNNKFNGLYHE